MTIEVKEIEESVYKAIEQGKIDFNSTKKNALNAEYALGEIGAYMGMLFTFDCLDDFIRIGNAITPHLQELQKIADNA